MRSDVRRPEESREPFRLAATEYATGPFDIPKEYRPYHDGAYITNDASLLLSAMYGFTGMRIAEGDWRKYPVSLPEGWKRIEIDRIWIKGHPWHVIAEQGKPLILTGYSATAPQSKSTAVPPEITRSPWLKAGKCKSGLDRTGAGLQEPNFHAAKSSRRSSWMVPVDSEGIQSEMAFSARPNSSNKLAAAEVCTVRIWSAGSLQIVH